ncbi:MAG: hypothetical protein WBO70_07965, partial [Erysipelotrichaceae bacterium]
MEIKRLIDDIKEFSLTKRRLVCKYHSGYVVNDFAQIVLELISDEPRIILENNTHFDYNSQSNHYFVKAENFEGFLDEDESKILSNYSLDDQIVVIEKYLQNKLIIVQPYYYFNNEREIFFKNGTVSDVVQVSSDCFYFCVPIIDMKTYDIFKNKKEFPLPLNSQRLVGTPEYLCYEKDIYSVELVGSSSNDTYWKANVITKLDIDYDQSFQDGDIIENGTNFLFLSQNAIKTALESIKKKSISDISFNDLEVTDSSKYEDSEIGRELENFFNFIKSNNLCYSLNDIYNFYTCVCSSQLIILAGISGTGKTKLPLKFAEYFNMSEENKNLLFLPISPSFNDPSDLLGYYNPNSKEYVPAETRFVDFLIHAQNNKEKMHLVVFDEMNLSQIEFWFAPFISLLEKDFGDRNLYLYNDSQDCNNKDQYPSVIEISNNIIFVGTINLDETTKNISDRLLDRSYIINLKKETFVNYQSQQSLKKSENIDKSSCDFFNYMPENDDYSIDYISNYTLQELQFFDLFHEKLNQIDSQKGVSFRSVRNIALYLHNKPEELDYGKAFDFAFKQTV